MKFTIATILALAATAFAYPAVEHNAPVRRQANIVGNIDVSIPAMADASGNVIPFDSTKVYKDATTKGL